MISSTRRSRSTSPSNSGVFFDNRAAKLRTSRRRRSGFRVPSCEMSIISTSWRWMSALSLWKRKVNGATGSGTLADDFAITTVSYCSLSAAVCKEAHHLYNGQLMKVFLLVYTSHQEMVTFLLSQLVGKCPGVSLPLVGECPSVSPLGGGVSEHFPPPWWGSAQAFPSSWC